MLKVKNTTKTGGTNAFANITVDGGCWDAKYLKKSKKSGGSIMYFMHINNLVIINAKLCHVYGASHMIEIGAADKVSISNCEFFGYKSPNPVGCKEAIQLDVSHCEDIEPDAKPYDDTPCSNVVIENNYIHDCGRGIGSHSAVKNVYHKQITIRKNRIANTMSEGMEFTGCSHNDVSYNKINFGKVNKFDNCISLRGQSVANAKIDDLKSISNSGYGIIFSNASTGYVQNSYIDSNKKTGVYVNDSTLTRINANKIINHTTRGMESLNHNDKDLKKDNWGNSVGEKPTDIV